MFTLAEVVLLASVFFGVFLSYCVVRVESLRDTRWFVFAGLVGLGAAISSLIWLGHSLDVIGGFIAFLIYGFGIAIFYGLFLAHSLSLAVMGLRSFLLSDENITIRKEFWAAQRAERNKEFEKAADLYREEIQKDSKDSEARRRLAELFVRMGRPEDAVRELKRAIEVCEEDDYASSTMLRLAELVERELGDPRRATQILKDLLHRYPCSYFAKFARERLAKLLKESS